MPDTIIQPPYEALVTEKPFGEVAAIYEAYKAGKIVSERSYLACVNFASFGGKKYFGETSPVPFGAAVTRADQRTIAAAFQELLPDADGTMKAGIGSWAFLVILKNVAIPLLIEFIKNR